VPRGRRLRLTREASEHRGQVLVGRRRRKCSLKGLLDAVYPSTLDLIFDIKKRSREPVLEPSHIDAVAEALADARPYGSRDRSSAPESLVCEGAGQARGSTCAA
jgi:hypothetical protein